MRVLKLPPGTQIYAVLAAVGAVGLLVLLATVGRLRWRAVQRLDRLRWACARGDGAVCQRLGWDYEQGQEVPLDLGRALVFYKLGCESNLPASCFFAGTLLEGRGQRQQAAGYYRRACEGGDRDGCTGAWRLRRR